MTMECNGCNGNVIINESFVVQSEPSSSMCNINSACSSSRHRRYRFSNTSTCVAICILTVLALMSSCTNTMISLFSSSSISSDKPHAQPPINSIHNDGTSVSGITSHEKIHFEQDSQSASIPKTNQHSEVNELLLEDEATVQVYNANSTAVSLLRGRRQRHLSLTLGRKTVLVVRVVTFDNIAPQTTSEMLKSSIFQSVGEQLRLCSANALEIAPVLSDQVLTVRVSRQHTDRDDLVGLAQQAATNQLRTSSLRDFADHVVIVLPQGAVSSFVAWAETGPNANIAVFYDNMATSFSVLMHEIAHNYDQPHARYQGDEYGDRSGMMGRSVSQADGPLMCYNAANHWDMGWYGNLRLDLGDSAPSTPRLVSVAAFTDHASVQPGQQYVLVKLGNVYMQLNQAKSYNSGTRMLANQLVLVESTNSNGQATTAMITSTLGGIDTRTAPYRTSFGVIEVCSAIEQNGVSIMQISVGQSRTDCTNASQSTSTISAFSTGSANSNNYPWVQPQRQPTTTTSSWSLNPITPTSNTPGVWTRSPPNTSTWGRPSTWSVTSSSGTTTTYYKWATKGLGPSRTGRTPSNLRRLRRKLSNTM